MTKILAAMSGGVDSTSAVLLLQKRGYTVEGATYLLTPDMKAQSERAAQVCAKIGIKHHEIDLVKLFEEKVRKHFAQTYLDGKTPNPCVVCNREIKFKAFLDYATENGFDKIATGHYCAISEDENGVHLLTGKEGKDQTYFLSMVDRKALSKVVFPVGSMDKNEVRSIVSGVDEAASKLKDSVDICFVPDGDYVTEVLSHANPEEREKAKADGDFVILKDGSVPGKHKGYINYTIGQRKGLGIAYTEPLYVVGTNPQKCKVYLGCDDDIYSSKVSCGNINIINEYSFKEAIKQGKLTARVRFSKALTPIKTISGFEGPVSVVFGDKVRAPAPGQTIAFYFENECVGGAEIIGNDFDRNNLICDNN